MIQYTKQLFRDFKVCKFNIITVILRRLERTKKKNTIQRMIEKRDQEALRLFREGKIFEAMISDSMSGIHIHLVNAQPLRSADKNKGIVVQQNIGVI